MISAPAKWKYLRAIHARYWQAPRVATGPIPDEFFRTTGSPRKGTLSGCSTARHPAPSAPRRRRPATYGPAVMQALTTI